MAEVVVCFFRSMTFCVPMEICCLLPDFGPNWSWAVLQGEGFVQNGVSLLILAGIVVTTVLQSVPAVACCASMRGGRCG